MLWKHRLNGGAGNFLMDSKKEGDEGGGGGSGNAGKGAEGDEDEDDKGSGSSGDDEDDTKDDSKELKLEDLPPAAQKLIKNLRKENGGLRNRAKLSETKFGKLKGVLVETGIIENDDESPEDKIKNLTNVTQTQSLDNAILVAAVENGIGKDSLDYFTFLVNKKLESLEEGQELAEEDFAAISLEVKSKTSGGSKRTGVESGGGNPPPDKKGGGGDGDAISVDKFIKMGTLEKSALYTKNPDVYNRLVAEAKEKGALSKRF